jgi:hypothetical protein
VDETKTYMKSGLLLFFLFITILSSSQEKLGRPFITGSVNLTLGINEDYKLFRDSNEILYEGAPVFNDNERSLIVPAAVFLRAGFGYEFKKKVAISFNAGYDYHWNYAISAFPTYGALKLNIRRSSFIEMSYGKMWRPSPKYPDGSYYGFGIGSQFGGNSRSNKILRLDFHSKGIYGFENNRIDSVSLGIGFSFF